MFSASQGLEGVDILGDYGQFNVGIVTRSGNAVVALMEGYR